LSRVIVGVETASGAEGGSGRSQTGHEWTVLAVLGVAFAVVSLVDVGLTFYPVGFGSPEWEFTTSTAVMNNLPLAVVGIGLMAGAGMARQSRPLAAAASVLAGLLGIVVLLLAALFLKNLGVARGSVTDPVAAQGMTEVIVRTSVEILAYLTALGWLAVKGRRV